MPRLYVFLRFSIGKKQQIDQNIKSFIALSTFQVDKAYYVFAKIYPAFVMGATYSSINLDAFPKSNSRLIDHSSTEQRQ